MSHLGFARARWIGLALLAACAVACSGGGGGGGGGATAVGALLPKPGGGLYFEDSHSSGRSSRLRLLEVSWGRLVNVHAIDVSGAVVAEPVLRDLVINENLFTAPIDFSLETNPITQQTRMIVRRVVGAPDGGGGTFEDLVQRAIVGLAGVNPKSDAPNQSPPFSLVARNATLMLQFDDLLDDGEESVSSIAEHVRILTGYPPVTPLPARIVFDPNHGGVTNGAFHSTRVLVDLTVSEAEAADSPVPIMLNSLGLPPSERASPAPNVCLRLPTRVDEGTGQFSLLHNLAGRPLDAHASRPFDAASPTLPVLRAVRSGADDDVNNGFLFDPDPPRVIGNWPCAIDDAQPDVADPFEWMLTVRFTTSCRRAPSQGDIVAVGERGLEVSATAPAPDSAGIVQLHARALGSTAPQRAELLGFANFQSVFRADLPVDVGCWVRFSPVPRTYPNQDVSSEARSTIRFSEPMDPASARPFDTLMTIRGNESTLPGPSTLVVGRVQPSLDLRELTFVPSLPYPHGDDHPLQHLRIPADEGVTDLAGNQLAEPMPAIEFTIDPESPRVPGGSFVLRFNSPDELNPIGLPDVRGQFVYHLQAGTLRPREVVFASRPVDRSNPMVSVMPIFPPGVITPLSPLGSKLQTVWRYADLGWGVRDETKYNLDVVGLYWSPARGIASSDFFEQFEVRLSHARKLPDERIRPNGGAKYTESGLWMSPFQFTDNILADPLSPQVVMNARSIGYRVDPNDLSLSTSGRPLMPWPVNRDGGPLVTFTWRDTAVMARGGDYGTGVPLDQEVGFPVGLENAYGTFFSAGDVPALALPLLMEFRCYPSDSGIGLNPVAIFLASNLNPAPNFRAYSTGGFDRSGQRILKNPDLELVPTGGFNPNSRPPGFPTARSGDNAVYAGQLDYVIRLSRAHTIWIDARTDHDRFVDVVLDPDAANLPPGTEIQIDFRGADGFIGVDQQPFNANALDPLGEIHIGSVVFHGGDKTWHRSIGDLDGARYIQMRFTFLNNISGGLVAELSGVGVAYRTD